MSHSPPERPLTESERVELERLRAQLAQGRRWARGGRWVGACVLMVLAAVIGLASVAAVWVRSEVLDTGRYVETVAPLATDPVVQDAVAARISDEIMTRLDVQGLATSLAESLETRGAPKRLSELVPPIVSGIRSFVNSHVHDVVTSEQFALFWENANRTAHDAISAILTGKDSKLLSTNNTAVIIDLGQVLEMVKQRLVDSGFTAAQRIPQQSIPYTIAEIKALPKIQRATSLLNTAAWVLPLLALLMGAAAVAVAPSRRRGLLITVVVFAVFLLFGLAAMALARESVLSNLPDTVRSPQAVAATWDIVVRFLLDSMKTLIVVCAIVFLACLLAGPSRLAHAVRRGVNWLLDMTARALGRIGLRLGSVPTVLASSRAVLRVGLVFLAFVTLVVWRHPGIEGTLGVTAITLAVLAIIEIISRIPPRTAAA